MADLGVFDLKRLMDLARDGDGTLLAETMRRNVRIHPDLREFLAAVVAGEIRLKRPRKLTIVAKDRRWLREERAARDIENEMRENGKQRDTDLRTRLTLKWAEAYGTTAPAIADYKRRTKSRRR